MKRKRVLISLILVLITICIIIGIEKTTVRYIEKINTVDKEIFQLTLDMVNEISWTNEGNTLSFLNDKNKGGWREKTDDEFPLDGDKIKNLLEKFESVHASFIIEDVKDYSQYGLDNPLASVEILCGSEMKKITFGAFSVMDSKRYVKTSDGNVYLIDDDLVQYLSTNRDDFMERDELYDYTILTNVSIRIKTATADASTLDIKYLPNEVHSYDDTMKYYQVDGTEYNAVDEKRLKGWLNKIKESAFTSYVTYKATDAEYGKYGLDQPTVKIYVCGQMDASEKTGEIPESYTVYVSDHGNNEYYLRVNNSRIIYKINQELYEVISNVNYHTIRPKKILKLDWEKVSGLRVVTGENTYEITKDTEGKYHLDGSILSMDTSIKKINALTVSDSQMKDIDEKIKGALEKKPELSLTIKLSIRDYESLKVDFYPLNGTDSIICLNGKMPGLVKRDAMSGLREAIIRATLD